ncbi:hypothetical protein FRC11_000392 [Ceratobasidium sp. 423]|nr:hypothetical protein FRC11_000392 [Ceratobasidium sp. 423]
MPRQSKKDTSDEAAVIALRNNHLIGTFTVFLNQTKNHPDQRALDQSWVENLIKDIGSPGILNRAKHPIEVILEGDALDEELSHLLDESGKDSSPILPEEMKVLVFAGQHRLAMLSQLGLDPDELWWHARVYKRELEANYPAEFLTMMHESNSPHVVKTTSDVDLFHTVVKLKNLLNAGTITEKVFLQNRCTLLGRSDERTRRAICNLTRNEKLLGAIVKALSRAHIAKVFSPGSWMRITTGRLYMVASGLVEEMTQQVDQLTRGMVEVPDQVMLRAQACHVSKIAGHVTGKKNKHAWDQLPGGRMAALKRACVRPNQFVTALNPKTNDPWTLPDVVLLPSCLGSKIIEDELRQMQKVTNHILKMVVTESHYERYMGGNPETIESATDHPEGMIAQFLQEKHPGDPNVQRYERKILHRVWVNRDKLDQDLGKYNVPLIESSDGEDYQRLIDKSKAWWETMRLFKVTRLRSRFVISIPKEFGSSGNLDTTEVPRQETSSTETPGSQGSKRTAGITDLEPRHKRVRYSSRQNVQDNLHSDLDGEGTGGGGSFDGTPHNLEQQPGYLSGGDDGSPSPNEGVLAPAAIQTHRPMEKQRDEEQAMGEDEQDLYESDGASQGSNSAPVDERQGGDRRLAKVLEQVMGEADCMTRSESRAVTELLEQIMASRGNGDMEYLVKGLVSKGKRILSKLEKHHEMEYDSTGEPIGGDMGGD